MSKKYKVKDKACRLQVVIYVIKDGYIGYGVISRDGVEGINLPGGGIDDDTLFEATKKEALEELGYEVKILAKLNTETRIKPFPIHSEKSRKRAEKYSGILFKNVLCKYIKDDYSLWGSEDDTFDITHNLPIEDLISLSESDTSVWADNILNSLLEIKDKYSDYLSKK